MDKPLRHRRTKGAATRMLDLTPPRHIPTLPRLCENVLPHPKTARDRDDPRRHDGLLIKFWSEPGRNLGLR